MLLALAALPAPAKPVFENDTLPETAAGRCVAAFLEMIADPTPERITAFETAHRSPKRLQESPMEERIRRARAAYFGMVSEVDELVGRVLDELEKTNHHIKIYCTSGMRHS